MHGYYFDEIIKFENFDFKNSLKDEKLHENVLIYVILHKTMIAPKPFRIRFDKVDDLLEFMMVLNNLISFGLEKYDALYSRSRYLIRLKLIASI